MMIQPRDLANPTGHGTYVLSSWLFLRLLGLIYGAAFVSLATQIKGLVGSRGILPAREFLRIGLLRETPRFLRLPTLWWSNAGDAFLQGQCWTGAALSLLLVAGVAPIPVLLLDWVLYLSLFHVGQVFLGYQWDILLLETGFLAVFIAPFDWLPEFPPTFAPSRIILWLFWWLMFRLMFSSGYVKWRSGDRSWRTLTALRHHYETQPLPTPLAWYLHQFPVWFHKGSVLVLYSVEVGLSVLVFAPPPACYVAGAAFILLMFLIMGSGNYCFFNLLAMALSILLFDDAAWRRWAPGLSPGVRSLTAGSTPAGFPVWIAIPVALVVALLSAEIMARLFRRTIRWPKRIDQLMDRLEPLRLVNGYGLFAVMTRERPEIIVEGSEDGVDWRAYEFKWKPGDPKRRPRLVAPHQPRLDWQMWFAALGHGNRAPWFRSFLVRLSRNSKDVLSLLANNPFPDKPPRFVRAVLYDYQFTDFSTRRETGAWWRRHRRGLFCPVLSADRPSGPQKASKQDEAGL